MMFDRSAILRAAHQQAKQARANNRAWRSYSEAFAHALRHQWFRAKEAAAHAAVLAEDAAEAALAAAVPADTADTARYLSDLRMIAEAQSFTSSGNQRRRVLLAEADDIERAARCMMIPAVLDPIHAAH